MKSQKKQSGAVLIVGVIMLLVLSVVVLAASKGTMLQQKMTTNFKDKELAFQAAETAIKTGEDYIKSRTRIQLNNLIFDGSNGFYSFDMDRSLKSLTDWASLNTHDSEASLHQVTETPVYIIENIIGVQPPGGSLEAAKAKDSYFYRISSKSKGGTSDSLVVLQTIYRR